MIDDCKQGDACATPPGCQRHWEARNRELVNRNAELVALLNRWLNQREPGTALMLATDTEEAIG